MTKEDVLNSNLDLINHAASLLKDMDGFILSANINGGADNGVTRAVKATTKNIDRLDVYVNGRPRLTLDVADGDNEFELPVTAGDTQLELRGYRQDLIAATTRLPIFVPAGPGMVVI